MLRRNKEGKFPPKDKSRTSDGSVADTSDPTVDDISQAKTAKAKSTLLQKKLAEDRKVFEQRNKQRTETKRAVEEKVEAIRQQLEEKDVSNTDFASISIQKDQPSITSIKPVVITSEVSNRELVFLANNKFFIKCFVLIFKIFIAGNVTNSN